jgi:hypothetical protein
MYNDVGIKKNLLSRIGKGIPPALRERGEPILSLPTHFYVI